MDEVWERAVETALDGQTDCSSARSLTLDGVVKCLHGRLPPPSLLEKFQALEHLSIANIGLSSLDKFPRLPNLQKLILSDNRIAGGLEFLVEAGLASLRDLDLSNNRIQFVEDLAPLAQLKLVSLDLYECPVTRVKDYRSRVFALIRSLKYLDKMDADDNERPESDEEEEDDEDDEEDDPGSGEIDGGEDRSGRSANGGRTDEGVVDADEDEESDADEEETATNGSERPQHHLTNGFRVAAADSLNGEDDEEDADDEEEDDLGEEIDEDDGEDEDVIEVHEIEDSDEDEDGVEEDDEEEDEEDEDEEDVEDEEEAEEPGSTGRLTSTEGEIDGHDQGEEDENGEIGEEDDQGIEEEGEYEEEDGEGEDEVRFLTSTLSSSYKLPFPSVFLSFGLKKMLVADLFYFRLFLHFQSKSCLYKRTVLITIVKQPPHKHGDVSTSVFEQLYGLLTITAWRFDCILICY